MQLTKKQWVILGVCAAAILALALAVKSCVEKPDPYRLNISEGKGFELVVPKD